ncbi:porin [Chitinilyticum piscinae]|uniref:Porin n=1 Tax=Chitinilyticum piscinae TaxID=2866724 RepID=A0A8J7FLS5_9NEIS|nr:porin [Chitinilyticum piscinae]MBE9610125.1 porin [Chitinilyticum piscinae]
MFKRVLVAAAVAAAFAAPAMAEVSISGSAEMDFFVRTNNTVDGDPKVMQEIAIVINVDGKDKLDNGSTLSWRLAQKVATPDRFDAWGIREAWIAYGGDWGTLKFGNQWSNTYLIQDWPYGSKGFSGTMGEVPNVGFGQGISYASPAFGPFSFTAQYDFGDTVNNAGSPYAYEVTGNLALGGWNIDAGWYQSVDSTPVPAGRDWAGGATSGRPNGLSGAKGTDYDNWIVGARGNIGDLGLRLAVRGADVNVEGGADASQIGYLIGGTYGFGKHAISLGYMFQEAERDGADQNDNDFQTIGFQWDYGLSKNTGAFLQIRHNMVGKNWGSNAVVWQNADGKIASEDNATRILVGTWTGF